MHEFSVINGLLWAGILLPVGSGLMFLLYALSKFWLEELDLSSDGLLKVARVIFVISFVFFVAGTFKACGSIDWSTPCCKKNQSTVKAGSAGCGNGPSTDCKCPTESDNRP